LSAYTVDFSVQPVESYGAGQDVSSTVSIEDAGGSLRITGNGWKKIAIPTVLTADSALEFDFSSTSQGEIHAIGFDTDNVLSFDQTFRLYGTQPWGLADYATYGGGVTHYRIPVGQFYTGTFDYLFFAMDDDAATAAESLFTNVAITTP
jgi:hypothetical protein